MKKSIQIKQLHSKMCKKNYVSFDVYMLENDEFVPVLIGK